MANIDAAKMKHIIMEFILDMGSETPPKNVVMVALKEKLQEDFDPQMASELYNKVVDEIKGDADIENH